MLYEEEIIREEIVLFAGKGVGAVWGMCCRD